MEKTLAARYAALGLPSWPNPHPGLAVTTDESEYSRVTDPGRYRIVQARARVWIACLSEVPGIRATAMTAAERTTMVVSPNPGALPLYVVESGGEIPQIRLAAGRPELTDDAIPDCGCDACDFGSDDILDAVDTAFLELIEGPVVLLVNPAWRARWFGSENGRSGLSGDLDFRMVMSWCEQLAGGRDVDLPPGTEALVGATFLP